ncbi:MAG TPA: Crp/Fnr family transcriptional regulator [Pseudorhodoplanes sp.]|nr:Crp/Fnr family transcriptional regulator [Pseudorhodoplanes sp.]
MSIEDDIKFLESIPLLRLVGRAGLRIVAIGAEQRYVHGGEILFHKNTHADSGYAVQEGAFALAIDPERDPVQTAGPGILLGEMALMADTYYGMTATATTSSTVMRIPRSLFLKMLEGYPDAARRIRDQIAIRAEESERDLMSIYNAMRSSTRGQ